MSSGGLKRERNGGVGYRCFVVVVVVVFGIGLQNVLNVPKKEGKTLNFSGGFQMGLLVSRALKANPSDWLQELVQILQPELRMEANRIKGQKENLQR